MKVREESEKAGLKLNIQKTKIMTSGPITSCQIEGEEVEAVSESGDDHKEKVDKNNTKKIKKIGGRKSVFGNKK